MAQLIMGLPDRFWAKTSIEDRGYETPCLMWTAYRMPNGYARYAHEGQACYAHRVVYETVVSPIPPGLTVDHLCRNRACVNPWHMEPVTNRVNILRGETIMATNAAKTHCVHGHEYTPENTIINPKTGRRRCATCAREQQDERNRQRREERAQHRRPEPTHCRKGHPYDEGNLRINKAGARVCRACSREAGRRYKERRRGAADD
jgi:HNH endonuclease